VKLFCRVCGRSAACLKQPVMARSTAIGRANSTSHRCFDRQKLTPIWPRFGLNNVSAWFHHIPVISQPTGGRAFPAVEAATFAEGNGAVAVVGTGRVRDRISLADANYGARCNFRIPRFDSNSSDHILRLVRIDRGFFRATDVPAWNRHLSHLERRPEAPLQRAPTGHRVQQPSVMRSSV
jgi:hypothetical protein